MITNRYPYVVKMIELMHADNEARKKRYSYTSTYTDRMKDHKRRTKQGRNEPCNCGSGKKFKKCCGGI